MSLVTLEEKVAADWWHSSEDNGWCFPLIGWPAPKFYCTSCSPCINNVIDLFYETDKKVDGEELIYYIGEIETWE